MGRLFDDQLALLNTELIEFGVLIEKAIQYTVQALQTGDIELALRITNESTIITHKEKEIEQICLKLLLNYQPVAKDLRYISSALKMITDMERIGHQCADISNIVVELYAEPHPLEIKYIPRMAEATMKMVTQSIDAFVKQDVEIAQAVIANDDIVDDLFKEVKRKLIDFLKQDTEHNEQTIDILMIAKYLERIGDHTVNIAEWVVFSITGKHTDSEC